jgi:hypothetical protein
VRNAIQKADMGRVIQTARKLNAVSDGDQQDQKDQKDLKRPRDDEEDEDDISESEDDARRSESKRKKARVAEVDHPVFAPDVAEDAERNTLLVVCGLESGEDSNVFAFTPEVHLSAPYLKVYNSLVAEGGADLSAPETIKEVARKRLIDALLFDEDRGGIRVKPDGAPINGKTMRVINVCF